MDRWVTTQTTTQKMSEKPSARNRGLERTYKVEKGSPRPAPCRLIFLVINRSGMSERSIEILASPPLENVERLRPIYFAVSPLKLVVMSTCTFGLYELYWFYRNWCYVKDREPKIMPFWRAFFTVLFCHSLFRRIRDTAKTRTQDHVEAGGLAVGWIILTFFVRLPDPFWLITFFAVSFLVPIQTAVNNINLANDPQYDRNSKFTAWNIAAVVIGGALFILALIGTLLPNTTAS